MIPEDTAERTCEQDDTEAVNSGQKAALSNSFGLKNTGTEGVLASRLEAAAPLATADPVFQRALLEKLMTIPTAHRPPAVERALDETERILERAEETKEGL